MQKGAQGKSHIEIFSHSALAEGPYSVFAPPLPTHAGPGTAHRLYLSEVRQPALWAQPCWEQWERGCAGDSASLGLCPLICNGGGGTSTLPTVFIHSRSRVVHLCVQAASLMGPGWVR